MESGRFCRDQDQNVAALAEKETGKLFDARVIFSFRSLDFPSV
jgi:hypothetical protein